MTKRLSFLFSALLAYFCGGGTKLAAYVREGQTWPNGTVVMHLQLGSSGGSLNDGSASWGVVAENALARWNQYISTVKFVVVRDSTIPKVAGDGKNSVFWSSTVFGSSFGPNVLAVTHRIWTGGQMTEADVVFNTTKSWNSYRGNLSNASGGGYLNDFYRVALHEFGHVLGLDHEDGVTAQMNSTEGNLDDLAQDDINGAQALYGGAVETVSTPNTPSGPTSGTVGTTYAYSTGGAASNLGNSVQYLLDWGDGTSSGWLSVGTTTWSHYWSSGGIFQVKALARSATDTSKVSSYSSALSVTMSAPSTPAVMQNPTPGSTLASSTATFAWSAGNGATGYWLYVGSTFGGSDFDNSNQLNSTTLSRSVSNLPTDGRTIYVRLYSQLPSGWTSSDYTYTAAAAILETVSTPNTPSGGPTSGTVGTTYTYSTGGAASNLGNSVQYLLDWGDGTSSGWLSVGTTTWSHYWSSGGTFQVKALARSATDTSKVSSYSSALSVTMVTMVTTYTVTPSAGANGSISPSAVQTVNSGASASFTGTPASSAYVVDQWYLNGNIQPGIAGNTSIYVTSVTSNSTIQVTFKLASASSNANLASLVPSSGVLSPTFASSTLDYTVIVGRTVPTFTVAPTAAQAGATVRVNGALVASGSASSPITLISGVNPAINIVVTAPDGVATQTYTLTVTRMIRNNARDLNNDGNADLVFQNNLGQIAAWYMNGAGVNISTVSLSASALGDWKVKGLADMNGDGNTDIIFQNNAGQIVVWYLDNAGAKTSSGYLSTSALGDWRVVSVADMNNDGNADILFQNNAGQIFVWYRNSSGTVTSSGYLTTSALGDWRVVGVADMNNDGNADLIFQNTMGQIFAWYMNGAGTKTSSDYLNTAGLGDWRVVGVADMNNDGNADLIFQNTIGQISAWYMNGAGTKTSSGYLYNAGLGDWRIR